MWFGWLHSVICLVRHSIICVVWQAAFSYLCGLAGCNQLCVWFGRLHSVICVVWQAASTRCIFPCPSYFWSIMTPVTFLSVFFHPSRNPPKAFIIGCSTFSSPQLYTASRTNVSLVLFQKGPFLCKSNGNALLASLQHVCRLAQGTKT